MATSPPTTTTQVHDDWISVADDSKPPPKLLKKIDGHTDKQQFEKVKFLANGLRLRGVSKVNSVPSLYRALDSACPSRETAIILLQHLLDKACVDPECRSQLSTYTTGAHDVASLQPKLYFREMLLQVAEEMGGGSSFEEFRNIVKIELDANVNKYKSPLAVFERLIDVGALKVRKESVEQLEQWLIYSGRNDIAHGTVQRYRETLLEDSEPELVLSESLDASTCDASETARLLGGEAEDPLSVDKDPGYKKASHRQGRTYCIIRALATLSCVSFIVILSFAVGLGLYSGGKLFAVPSDRNFTLYNSKPMLAYGTGIDTYKSHEASLMVTKGIPYAVITACTLTSDSNQHHIHSRAINYTHSLARYANVRWIAKLGTAPDPVDKFEYIIEGTLYYSLRLNDNIDRMEHVTLSFYNGFDACRKYADNGVTGHTDMNGVSCKRSNTISVVTYACDFSKPAYRCAVWTVPSYTNFTYSTYGRIEHYRIGGSNDSDHKTCYSFAAVKGSKKTIPLNPPFTWSTEWRYLLMTLSNAYSTYEDVTVMVQLDTSVFSSAFACGSVVVLIAVIALFISGFCLLRYLLNTRRKSPPERPMVNLPS